MLASSSLPTIQPILGWKHANWQSDETFLGQSLKDSQLLVPDFSPPDAYTTLIGAVFEGQRHLFTSQDMLLASWEIWDDVIKQLNRSRPRVYEGRGKDSQLLDFAVDGRSLTFVEEQNIYTIPYATATPKYANVPSDFIGQRLISEPKQELVAMLAKEIQDVAVNAIADKGTFHLALSGGQSPRALLRHMAQFESFPWHHTHIWFVDERCVPFSSDGSNMHMVEQELLQHVSVPFANVHPMPVLLFSDFCAADDRGPLLYEAEIGRHLKNNSFDFLLLGVGMDMHTASLFPQQPELQNADDRLVAIAHLPDTVHVAEKLRMTLTFSAINQAKHIAVLVTGKTKHRVLQNVTSCELDDVSTCPIRGVTSSAVMWYIDYDALFG